MYTELDQVKLKDGSTATLALIQGPDADWAEQIKALLGHKGGLWNWQNEQCIDHDLGFEARYYVLIQDGKIFSNIATFELNGVGVFGHVWTNEDMREKGAASHLNEVVINAFKSRGRALLLGTTYDTVPYKIYQKYGFNGIEKESGYMDYYSDSKAEFEDYFFATDNLQMRPVGWLDWPTAPCLYLNSFPGVVRSMQMGIIGRSSTEGGMLGLIKHNESNDDKLAWSLYNPQTGAVLATAGYRWHPLWPETLILDFYSHPDCWERCHDLIEKLKLPETTRLVAYSDFENPRKNRVLADLGFSEVAEFQNRVYKDTAKTVLVDVFEYEKRK